MVKMTDKLVEQKESTKTPHPGGRPTKYSQDMPDRLRHYMDECPHDLPSIPGFARFVKVSETTIHNWGEKHPEFLVALDELHTEQHLVPLNKGLTGAYNSTICNLILSGNHGYKERADRTSGDKPIGSRELTKAELRELLQDNIVDCEHAIAT